MSARLLRARAVVARTGVHARRATWLTAGTAAGAPGDETVDQRQSGGSEVTPIVPAGNHWLDTFAGARAEGGASRGARPQARPSHRGRQVLKVLRQAPRGDASAFGTARWDANGDRIASHPPRRIGLKAAGINTNAWAGQGYTDAAGRTHAVPPLWR